MWLRGQTNIVMSEHKQMEASPTSGLAKYFHMVNRLLPEGQVLRTVTPETTAREALRIMHKHGYSQLPVKQGDTVLGVFSYRAFALECAKNPGETDMAALPVEDFLIHEEPAFARLSDEFRTVIDIIDKQNYILVSSPDELLGILTPMDVLRYLYGVTNVFVLIEEIELALRALILAAVGEDELFQQCVENALSVKYASRRLPTKIADLSFDDYIGLVRAGRNWEYFQGVFGGTRERVRGRLEPIRNMRNDVFHFRRDLSVKEHEDLVVCRDWLLRCVRRMPTGEEAGT